MDSVQVGKAVFVKESYTTLGIEPRTYSYPGRISYHNCICCFHMNLLNFMNPLIILTALILTVISLYTVSKVAFSCFQHSLTRSYLMVLMDSLNFFFVLLPHITLYHERLFLKVLLCQGWLQCPQLKTPLAYWWVGRLVQGGPWDQGTCLVLFLWVWGQGFGLFCR